MAGVPTSSIFGTESLRIQEILNKSIDFILPQQDPFWRDTIVTSQGVGPAGDLGRDLKILKIYFGSLAGVFEQAGPRNDFVLYGDNLNTDIGSNVFLQGQGFSSNANVFPDPLNGANPKPYRLGIPMRAMVGNIAFTLGEMSAEALPATIGDLIAPKLEGFARNISHQLCNYWYLSQNTFYALCSLTSGAVSPGTGIDLTIDTNKTVRFSPTNLAVNRFVIGMLIQFYDSTGVTVRSTATNQTTFVVTRVDNLRAIVEAKALDGLAVNGAGITTADIVVFNSSKGTSNTPFSNASPYFTGIAGINSWLKYGDGTTTSNKDNCLLGDERDTSNEINVNVHSEFKSFQHSMANQPLTEHTMRKIFRRFHAAKNIYNQYVDCVVGSDGVWLAYESSKIGRELIDRTGRLASVRNEGNDNSSMVNEGFKFAMDGRTYEGYTSMFIESKTVYAHRKGGNNWKRYVPPLPKGTRKFDRSDAFAPFEFVSGALTGTGSNQIPIYRIVNNQNLLTEFVQMPGMLRMQLVPDQPAGIKLTNVAEDRMWADA